MIVGLSESTSGTINVFDQVVTNDTVGIKNRIGYLPEESSLYENMTVSQYLVFFSELCESDGFHRVFLSTVHLSVHPEKCDFNVEKMRRIPDLFIFIRPCPARYGHLRN